MVAWRVFFGPVEQATNKVKAITIITNLNFIVLTGIGWFGIESKGNRIYIKRSGSH